MTSRSAQDQKILSVTQLNRSAKQLLERNFPNIWVEGEISNFTQPSSGHWYFTLKDAGGQVRCAMFRGSNLYIKPRPKSGDKVKVRGRVSLYEGRGDFQLIIEHLESAGFGDLQRQFEQLKQSLQQEGLFSPETKQTLPTIPKHIAAVTSPSGAAIRDVISVLKRRMPNIPITIIPCPVQGEDAPRQIMKALDIAEQHDEFDVILLCRGGGSIEDLWAFNSEALARKIFQCRKPIVSAVGHEVDFTIADFVADVRAPTPSAAAELLSPNGQEISLRFTSLSRHLEQHLTRLLTQNLEQLNNLKKRLKHPRDKLEQWSQTLDQFEIRLNNSMQSILNRQHHTQKNLSLRLNRENPQRRIEIEREKVTAHLQSLSKAIRWQMTQRRQQFDHLTQSLDQVSPLQTMKRGYTITSDEQGRVLHSASQVETDSILNIAFADGEVMAKTVRKTLKTNTQ